jgi:LCP family protein required for cell wall assembly
MRDRGRLARALLAVTATVSILVSGVGAYGYVAFNEAQGSIRHFGTGPSPSGSIAPTRDYGPCVNDICNYLILGSDSRSGLSHAQQVANGSNADIGGSNRSDVIILVHTDPSQDKATIVSFPRDLWVPIPGHGKNKINSAFEGGINGGGPQLVTRTVENLTGLHINHVLYVDLAGFEGIVQALGGVYMCIDAQNVNTPGWVTQESATGSTQVYINEVGHIVDPNTGLDIKPGCQTLTAEQALGYVRTRHLPCDNIPDFSRIGRQQQFLRAVLNTLLQPSEIAKAPGLIKPIAHNLVTDQSFQLADIIYLVKQLQGLGDPASSTKVDFRTVPGHVSGALLPGYTIPLSIVRMDPSAQVIFKALRDDQPVPGTVGQQLPNTLPSEANIPTLVVDHDSAGKATTVETTLSNSGFDVTPGLTTFATSGFSEKGTAILYKKGHELDAEVVQKYFSNMKLVQAKKGELTSSPVAVLVSGGYKPVPVGSGPTGCVSPTG